MRAVPILAALLLSLPLDAAFSPTAVGSAVTHRHTARAAAINAKEPLPSEQERVERLQQLFGNDAGAQIAERTTSQKKSRPVEEEDIAMLQDGVQRLEWGSVRLIDVDMAEGPLEGAFVPLLPESDLLCMRLDMPLAMLLEENDDAAVEVLELLDGGSAREGGVREGDLLRATTAVTMAMSYPTWQLMMGGVGKPSLQKVLFSTQGEPFEKVMAAIASNSREQQGNGQAVLFIERARAAR
jgi:hypothetical protein